VWRLGRPIRELALERFGVWIGSSAKKKRISVKLEATKICASIRCAASDCNSDATKNDFERGSWNSNLLKVEPPGGSRVLVTYRVSFRPPECNVVKGNLIVFLQLAGFLIGDPTDWKSGGLLAEPLLCLSRSSCLR
jgi:hypothetical protein